MTSTNYISIKSVLYDLISTIDERYWNETVMLEWATKALRKVKAFSKFVDKVTLLAINCHKGQLPPDLVYITQIAWQPYTAAIDPEITLPSTSDLATKLNALPAVLNWAPMRLTSNPYFGSICLDESIIACPSCVHEFSVDENLFITTTLKDGNVMVAYKGYPTNDAGDALMPDNEDLKDAILHYVLYRYWMSKYQMKEDGAQSHMDFHLTMWSNLAAKAAGTLNMPDLSTLENIKNMRNRLIPKSNRYNEMFLTLSNAESTNF